MPQLAGVLTLTMIVFGLLTACGKPASAPQSDTVIILPDG